MQPTKIQINSLEAIERLIGGDTELEIEVRASVVHAFVDKHLRGLVREMAASGLENSFSASLKNDFLQSVTVGGNSWNQKTELRLKEPLAKAVELRVKEVLDEEIRRVVKESAARLEAMVQEKFALYTEHIKQNLEPRIADSIITDLVRRKLAAL